MKITPRQVRNCIILDCSGRITLGPDTMAVRNAVRDALEGGAGKIVLNLAGVDYIDSAGIGELVSSLTHVRNQGGKLVLLNLNKKTHQLMVVTKLITVFEVFEEEKWALVDC